jgi:hypothetical protein
MLLLFLYLLAWVALLTLLALLLERAGLRWDWLPGNIRRLIHRRRGRGGQGQRRRNV